MRVPLTHHQMKMTSTWRDNGDIDWFLYFIILCCFYNVLFYRFPTSISLFSLASCDFQLGISGIGVDIYITHRHLVGNHMKMRRTDINVRNQ